jgi:hypothetical protein
MMKTVRGYRADDVAAWQDAVRVALYARAELERNPEGMPVRVASARLFHDSKRIESLTGALDVLLAGSVQSEVRDPIDLWSELNLFREEQPVRMAGRIPIERTRVTALLDAPYGAFSAAAIVGLVPDTLPKRVLSIENLTTFHLEAKRRCEEPVLLLYTAGTPSPPWRAMYGRLLERLPRTTPLQHWGDLDEGGFRIAAQIATEALRQATSCSPGRCIQATSPSNIDAQPSRPRSPACNISPGKRVGTSTPPQSAQPDSRSSRKRWNTPPDLPTTRHLDSLVEARGAAQRPGRNRLDSAARPVSRQG